MVSVLSVLRLKSDAVAGETAAAETVRVRSWLESALNVAVIVVEPPSSEIEAEPSTSETVGVPSSSVIVNVWLDGAATPLPPETVAETVTLLSGASTSNCPTAVMVTVPVLVVEPAAMVSFLLVLTEKSDAVAGDTAAAETVSVTSWLDSALRVAVTVVEPPFSLDRRGAQLQGHSRRAVVVGDRQT